MLYLPLDSHLVLYNYLQTGGSALSNYSYLVYMHVDFNRDFMSYTVYKPSCYIITALFVDDFDSQLVSDFTAVKFAAMRFSTQIISRRLLHILFSMMNNLMVTSTTTKYE